jgi:DNA ligase-4
MGFKYTYICDLLSQLESNRAAKAASAARQTDPDVATVTRWFDRHQKVIHDGTTDRLSLLSCLFPEKRSDRVYGLREPSLVKVIGRCLLLGTSRREELDRWRERGGGDLGQCVENVMRQAENGLCGVPAVTVEEVDYALGRVAAGCRFSGPNVRAKHSAVAVDDALAPIFRRLSSRDAKWLTRLILKDLTPVVVPSGLVLRTFHFLLPNLLTFQDSLEEALKTLSRDPINSFPQRPSRDFAQHLTRNIGPELTPRIGAKIGCPDFYKGRSIDHCCMMAAKRTMSVEKKYDGEYCQVHIDLSKGHNNCIQIFSKSGKDSTQDRRGVHKAIKECLRIGSVDCKISDLCILEGELLVWGDKESDVLPFHKLRKHISRSGSFIGTENDSPYGSA